VTAVAAAQQPGTWAGEVFPATSPAEARGRARDAVRMLVARAGAERPVGARLLDLPRFLRPGDVVVVNASAVLPASLPARDPSGAARRLHLSTELDDGRWLVEVRLPHGDASRPSGGAAAGLRVHLPAGGHARLVEPFGQDGAGARLWVAEVVVPGSVAGFLQRYGRPIRYGPAIQPWPLTAYQTMFATEPGSAESPSAGRGFTPRLLARLRAHGVETARIVLHTGVSSQESGEPPYPERFRVPHAAVRAVATARRSGGRVIAVGTTVTRALETVAGPDGTVRQGEGWTDLVVSPRRGVRAVDGLLSGWHEPTASHTRLLEAVAGRDLLDRAYAEAIAAGYHGHEFGDLVLLLP
jgi:S-adenosylmethionine:tRNA ribosyltransferase-isomerase